MGAKCAELNRRPVEISPRNPLFSRLQSIETRERLFRTKETNRIQSETLEIDEELRARVGVQMNMIKTT
jgi:hypothetical protein